MFTLIIEKIFRFIGGSVCHQIHERTFFVGGHYLNLCSRCTGIYSSMLITIIYLAILKRLKSNKPPDIITTIIIAFCYFPMAFDGVSSYLGFRDTTNIIRFITGIIFAFGLPILFVLIANFEISGENTRKIIKNPLELGFLLILNLLVFALIKSISYFAWLVLSLTNSLALITFFFIIISILIKKIMGNKPMTYALSIIFTGIIIVGFSSFNTYVVKGL